MKGRRPKLIFTFPLFFSIKYLDCVCFSSRYRFLLHARLCFTVLACDSLHSIDCRRERLNVQIASIPFSQFPFRQFPFCQYPFRQLPCREPEKKREKKKRRKVTFIFRQLSPASSSDALSSSFALPLRSHTHTHTHAREQLICCALYCDKYFAHAVEY